jgi:hypothetical protein
MKAGKEGQESRDWAHRRPKKAPVRESYRKGRTDHATWQILRRCESTLLMDAFSSLFLVAIARTNRVSVE